MSMCVTAGGFEPSASLKILQEKHSAFGGNRQFVPNQCAVSIVVKKFGIDYFLKQ
jgi:hypothetical protein